MTEYRLSMLVFYGQLKENDMYIGTPKLRFNDHIKHSKKIVTLNRRTSSLMLQTEVSGGRL